jgi:thioredoxin reductase
MSLTQPDTDVVIVGGGPVGLVSGVLTSFRYMLCLTLSSILTEEHVWL